MHKPDSARKFTDKELRKIEREIKKIYGQSEKEISAKFKAYMKRSGARIAEKESLYLEALKTGSKEQIEAAKTILDRAKMSETIENARYKAMIDQVALNIAKTNQLALDYLNGRLPRIYVECHNAIAPTAESLGIDFTIVNERAVMNMIKAGDLKLPKKKISIPKDKRWNTKQMNSEVLQGIIQGEPMDKIADRIFPIIDEKTDYTGLSKQERDALLKKNEQSAIRNARTSVTQAENLGRLDSYRELEDSGAVIKKVWEATGDDRTRESHKDIDGEERDINELFSNRLMYPADPDGDGAEVWNCRCTMTVDIIGFKDEKGKVHYL